MPDVTKLAFLLIAIAVTGRLAWAIWHGSLHAIARAFAFGKNQLRSSPESRQTPPPIIVRENSRITQDHHGRNQPDHEITVAPAAPIASIMKHALKVRDSNVIPDQTVFMLHTGLNALGRSEPTDTGVYPLLFGWDNAISREHLLIDVRSNGRITATDRHSRFGTRLNGERMEGGRPYAISLGDTLQFGNTLVAFIDPAQPVSPVADATDPTQDEIDGVTTPYMRVEMGMLPLQLRVVGGKDAGAVLRLDGRHWIVGRGRSARWQLRDRKMSREHAEIVREGNIIRIRDLKSKHGTMINKRPAKNDVLAIGATLRMGSNRIKLERI